jgi:RNA polymerase sigma factor (sigma-70 family)
MTKKPEPARGAIATFFSAERNRLVAYVRRLIDDAGDRDGEDVVQEVALAILSRPDFLIPIETLSSYVYQSLRNRVIDHFRRPAPMLSLDESRDENGDRTLADLLAPSAQDVESEVTRSELKRRITEAIDKLPWDQREIVIETEFKGRKFADLSEEWGSPVGTLLARKSRAMAKMRKSLKEYKER